MVVRSILASNKRKQKSMYLSLHHPWHADFNLQMCYHWSQDIYLIFRLESILKAGGAEKQEGAALS
jgi:hypothetical protein